MSTNLQFITSFEITDEVSSFTIDNVFTSQYDVYCLVADKWSGSTTAQLPKFRYIDNSGSVISDAEYSWASMIFRMNLDPVDVNDDVDTEIQYSAGFYKVDSEPSQTSAITYVYNPADSTSYTYTTSQATGRSDAQGRGYKAISVHKSQEAITGFKLETPTGNFASGKMSVYGVL